MRRLVVNLDDELDLWLSQQPNQNETVRNALMLYKSDIVPDTVEGFRVAFTQALKIMKEVNSKVDYLASK